VPRTVYPSEASSRFLRPEGPPRSQVPAERYGDEADMSGVILFLASRAGAFVNGNVLVTDGGSLSLLPATY
jgi:NAD(P)-dependent dehydrogenase (short-subunit alcohol dehydrogenase family)